MLQCASSQLWSHAMPEKKEKGRPPTWSYPERIDATPEEIAEQVLSMPPKKRGEWRFRARQYSRDSRP